MIPAMADIAEQIAALLHEAAETHHIVFRITDGDEPLAEARGLSPFAAALRSPWAT